MSLLRSLGHLPLGLVAVFKGPDSVAFAKETTARRSGCGRNVAARGTGIGDQASCESQAAADSRASDAHPGLKDPVGLIVK